MTKAEELAAKVCAIGHSALKTCGSCSRLVDHFEAAMAFERAQERKRCVRIVTDAPAEASRLQLVRLMHGK